MNKRSPDILWKALLEAFFDDAIRFFRPSLFEKIDWSVAPEFLDKELEALFPEAETADARADKLTKVRLLSGDDAWVLIHIEVQGYRDSAFEERMFAYFVRIRERFGRRIWALAILTDTDKRWRPTQFREEFEATEAIYRFPTFKVLDFPPEKLEAQAENPFSTVIETAYWFAKTYRSGDVKKLAAALELMRRLLKRGYSVQHSKRLLQFIRIIFRFKNPEFERTFEAEIDQLTNFEPTMTIEEITAKWAFEDGIEKGIEKGRVEGIEKGILESAARMLRSGMTVELVSNILDLPLKKVRMLAKELAEKAD